VGLVALLIWLGLAQTSWSGNASLGRVHSPQEMPIFRPHFLGRRSQLVGQRLRPWSRQQAAY
jgi:hypothetical protein